MTIVPKPAIATRSIVAHRRRVGQLDGEAVAIEGLAKPPKSSRETSSASMPAPRATSSPDRVGPRATRLTSSPACTMASKIVPEPDTKTQRRTSSKR